MKHCRVIFSSCFRTDDRQRTLHELTGHVHGDLSRLYNGTFAALGKKRIAGDAEIIAHHFLDLVDRDIRLSGSDDFRSYLLSHLYGNFLVGKSGVCNQGNQRAFQFPEVGLDTGCQEMKDIFRQFDPLSETSCLELGESCREIWFFKLDRQSPFQPGQQPFLEILEIGRSTVRSEDQLFA